MCESSTRLFSLKCQNLPRNNYHTWHLITNSTLADVGRFPVKGLVGCRECDSHYVLHAFSVIRRFLWFSICNLRFPQTLPVLSFFELNPSESEHAWNGNFKVLHLLLTFSQARVCSDVLLEPPSPRQRLKIIEISFGSPIQEKSF